ncbi:endonuclease domain-containing protein [Streptomyces sp. NPDC050211]|uniref:endonuclease domain-containing protein n=1 Tax=Streptomyces sp. NPDC050211 TaxID=3154932 RepID=UPI00343A15ED
MLISEKLARQYLADETQGCTVPVAPQQFRRRRNIEHSYVFFGDVPVCGYKHKNRWGFDEREVRRAGRAVAAVQWEAGDAVDAQLPDSEPAWSDQPDWRRDLRRWMSHAADTTYMQGGCPCGPYCRQEGLTHTGLPCGLTWDGFVDKCSGWTIACTAPVNVLSWSEQRWWLPRPYAEMLDRWESAERELALAARQCTGCGTPGQAWAWRTSSTSGWNVLCPTCSVATFRRYQGHLRGTSYNAVRGGTTAEDYLCAVCDPPRQAAFWDHCHDHGHVRGPLCASCNTMERAGTDFLTHTGSVAHLLECRGCLQQRSLPRHHHLQIVRNHLHATKRHQRCDMPATACVKITAQGDVLHCVLRCWGQSQSEEQELSAYQVTELVRRTVEAARADTAGP